MIKPMKVSLFCAHWWVKVALRIALFDDDQHAHPALMGIDRVLTAVRKGEYVDPEPPTLVSVPPPLEPDPEVMSTYQTGLGYPKWLDWVRHLGRRRWEPQHGLDSFDVPPPTVYVPQETATIVWDQPSTVIQKGDRITGPVVGSSSDAPVQWWPTDYNG